MISGDQYDWLIGGERGGVGECDGEMDRVEGAKPVAGAEPVGQW